MDMHAIDLIAGGAADALLGGHPIAVQALPDRGGGMPTLEVSVADGMFMAKVATSGPDFERLEKERRLGEFMATLSVRTPRLQLIRAGSVMIGVYRKLEGQEATAEFIKAHFSPAEMETFVSDMADLLARMHSVRLEQACHVLGIPPMSGTQAAARFPFGYDWLKQGPIEEMLASDLNKDADLLSKWRETMGWFVSYENPPFDMVFGHGDLHGGNVLVSKQQTGWKFSGILDLQLGGIVNLYDEFLRIILLDERETGPRIIRTYNHMMADKRRVDPEALRHACRAFAFYLAHEQSGEARAKLLRLAKGI